MQVAHRLALARMTPDDIAIVQQIERDIFPSVWPRNAYANELSQNPGAWYIVLRSDTEVVGYGGVWTMAHEAHVTTLGVRAQDQGRGYGKVLLTALMKRAYETEARWVTLEVRQTNTVAIHMYEAFGFKAIGRRRGYYTDNGEDAIVMWSDSIHARSFTERFARLSHDLPVEYVQP